MSEAYLGALVETMWICCSLALLLTRVVVAPSRGRSGFVPLATGFVPLAKGWVAWPASLVPCSNRACSWSAFCDCCAWTARSIILPKTPFFATCPGGGGVGSGGGVITLRGSQWKPGKSGKEPKPVMKYCCTAPKRLENAQ